MKKIILAIDSFKGCMTSEEVENAISSNLNSKEIEIHKIPMSDGGEGMLQAFISAMGGKIKEANVHDPLMRPITAPYGITSGGTAVIETAKACGLTLMTAEERNPMKASTYGVGELIIHAMHSGCRNFIIGLGGLREQPESLHRKKEPRKIWWQNWMKERRSLLVNLL